MVPNVKQQRLDPDKNFRRNNIVLLSEKKNTIFDKLAHQHLQAADYPHCFKNYKSRGLFKPFIYLRSTVTKRVRKIQT